MILQGGNFNYFLDNESKTIEEIRNLVRTDMTVSIDGLSVRYSSPKKETQKQNNIPKQVKILKQVEEHQKQNGGILQGMDFPFDNVPPQVKEVYINAVGNLFKELQNAKKETEGQKHNEGKLPIDTMITIQFPKAIQAICKATLFGHNKYKETDKDWLNYKRVYGGSQTYAEASARHGLDKHSVAEDSGLPHIYHKVWNAMAELELWIEENKYE